MTRLLLVVAFLFCASSAQAQVNECAQTWTFTANMVTLRNGANVGGIGHPSAPFYRCVNGSEIWVIGQDGATWWRYNGNSSWSGPFGDPGGVQFIGTLNPLTGECSRVWSFGPNMATLRDSVWVGNGAGAASRPEYRCVGTNTVYVIGQDALTWYRWADPVWTNVGTSDPGGVPIGVAPPPNQVFIGEQFSLVGDHDPSCLDTTKNVLVNCTLGYRIYDNNVQVGVDIPPVTQGTANVTVTSPRMALMTTGPHSLVLAAFNAKGEAKAEAIDVTSVAPPALAVPTAPSGARVQ